MDGTVINFGLLRLDRARPSGESDFSAGYLYRDRDIITQCFARLLVLK